MGILKILEKYSQEHRRIKEQAEKMRKNLPDRQMIQILYVCCLNAIAIIMVGVSRFSYRIFDVVYHSISKQQIHYISQLQFEQEPAQKRLAFHQTPTDASKAV